MRVSYFLLAALAVSSCFSIPSSTEYTRGIGVYPGKESDYSGPSVFKGDNEYRNLALGRCAIHSSSYDYNLTAQLATDGVISENEPVLLKLTTSDGEIGKGWRDALFDGNKNRSISLNAEKGAFVKAEFSNLIIDCDRVVLESNLGSFPVGSENGRIFTARLPKRYEGNWNPSLMRFFKDGEELSVLTSEHFVSCWMPETTGKEWMYVDLGSRSKVERIRLHWIGDIPEGCVEISDDAETWTHLCGIKADCRDNLSVKGRYVRVRIDKSNGELPCRLSELEVYGKGGVKIVAAAQPSEKDGILYLTGGDWKLQRSSLVETSGEDLSKCGYDDLLWTVATVPGTVANSYFNAGSIPDIRYDDDQLQISESFFMSDFWYRDEFYLPENYVGKQLLLNFDGINWKADIWVNGKSLGNLEGAYKKGRFDVTEYLMPGQKNAIAVLIHRNAHPGTVKEQTAYSTDLNGGVLGADNPTFHASIGWDWIPTVRGRNIGIWNDVYISSSEVGVFIENPYVSSDLPLPSVEYADLTPTLTLKNYTDKYVSGVLNFNLNGRNLISENVSIEPNTTKTVTMESVRIDNPELWWPAGYGEQYLYDGQFTYLRDDVLSDETDFKLGIREMSYDDADGSLDIYVNGRRLICNGGNWGFPEINLNYRAREYDIAVAYHADMGFTMIRNWVGQTGDKEFYEACDRHGVMVWQDFWLANPWDGPDPYYHDLFLDNAKDYLLGIRNHPSIALYCGRNEGMPPVEINDALGDLIAEYHPESHYIPHSASITVSGFGPYRAIGPDAYFGLEPGRTTLHSERGMPNVMTYQGMLRTFDRENQWPQNNVWGIHDYTLESAQRCETFNSFIYNAFGEPKDMKQFSKWAQWINYDGYRAMYESRSWNRKGLLIWMSHSCWPSMVWQTYDYYFEPTAAYFGAKKGSAPIRVQYNPELGRVEVVNNNASDQVGLVATALVTDMYGRELFKKSIGLDSFEDTTVPLFPLAFDSIEGLTDVFFVKLCLKRSEKILASNFYVRGKEYGNFKKLLELPEPALNVEFDYDEQDGLYLGTIKVRNEGDSPALMLRFNVVRNVSGEQVLPVFYEDNYISLLPGEERRLGVRFKREDTGGEKPRLEYEISL